MSKFLKLSGIITVCLVVILAILVFTLKGRYQITFGTIQEEWHWLPPEKVWQDEKFSTPVCFKIDTITGKTWVYHYYYWVGPEGKTELSHGFRPIPNKYRTVMSF